MWNDDGLCKCAILFATCRCEWEYVCITVSSPERSDIKYAWIPSSVYQYMISLTVYVILSGEVNERWFGNLVLCTIRYFNVASLATVSPLLLLVLCKLLFAVISLEICVLAKHIGVATSSTQHLYLDMSYIQWHHLAKKDQWNKVWVYMKEWLNEDVQFTCRSWH
jgi:hypothetical protein